MFLVESGRGKQLPEAVSGSKRPNYKEEKAERPGGYNVQRRKLLRVQGNHLLWGQLNLLPCRNTGGGRDPAWALPSRE